MGSSHSTLSWRHWLNEHLTMKTTDRNKLMSVDHLESSDLSIYLVYPPNTNRDISGLSPKPLHHRTNCTRIVPALSFWGFTPVVSGRGGGARHLCLERNKKSPVAEGNLWLSEFIQHPTRMFYRVQQHNHHSECQTISRKCPQLEYRLRNKRPYVLLRMQRSHWWTGGYAVESPSSLHS